MSTQVTYEIDHISLLRDSTTSSVPIFFFFFVFYCNLKEKYIKRNVDSKKRNVYTGNQYYYFDLLKIRVGQALQQKISCLCVRTNAQTSIFFPVKKTTRKSLVLYVRLSLG